MRNVIPFQHILSNELIYTHCINDNGTVTSCEGDQIPLEQQIPSASASFSSCIFFSMSSSNNGSAISFTCGGSLSIHECSFSSCCNSVSNDDYSGGGAIHINPSSQLTVTSSNFIDCTTPNYGGGILAQRG